MTIATTVTEFNCSLLTHPRRFAAILRKLKENPGRQLVVLTRDEPTGRTSSLAELIGRRVWAWRNGYAGEQFSDDLMHFSSRLAASLGTLSPRLEDWKLECELRTTEGHIRDFPFAVSKATEWYGEAVAHSLGYPFILGSNHIILDSHGRMDWIRTARVYLGILPGIENAVFSDGIACASDGSYRLISEGSDVLSILLTRLVNAGLREMFLPRAGAISGAETIHWLPNLKVLARSELLEIVMLLSTRPGKRLAEAAREAFLPLTLHPFEPGGTPLTVVEDSALVRKWPIAAVVETTKETPDRRYCLIALIGCRLGSTRATQEELRKLLLRQQIPFMLLCDRPNSAIAYVPEGSVSLAVAKMKEVFFPQGDGWHSVPCL